MKQLIIHRTYFTLFLLGPNIHQSTLFSDTLNPCCSHIVRDQVSHPQSQQARYNFVYFNLDIRCNASNASEFLSKTL